MRRFVIHATVAAFATAMVFAAPAYTANGTIGVTPSTVLEGGTVHISGKIPVKKCPASDGATVTSTAALFPPDGFGPTATRDSQGAFAVDYTVPTSTPAGNYDVGLRCGGGNVGISATLKVTAVPSGGVSTGSGGTAHGSPFWTIFGAACILLAGVIIAARQKLARRSG
jgi:hypothetical protein